MIYVPASGFFIFVEAAILATHFVPLRALYYPLLPTAIVFITKATPFGATCPQILSDWVDYTRCSVLDTGLGASLI